MLLLDAGFPVPAVPPTSGFPLSPLALLAAGRTDFFMLSSLTLVHGQLNTEEGRGKVKDVRMRSHSSSFPSKKILSTSRRERERKKSVIITSNSRKHLSVSAISLFG